MGHSYSRLSTAPLIGSIMRGLMSTNYFNNNNGREKAINININMQRESYHQDEGANKIQKITKLVPVIEFL